MSEADARRELQMIYSRLKRISTVPSLPRGIYEDIRQTMEDLEHVNEDLLRIGSAAYNIRGRLDYIGELFVRLQAVIPASEIVKFPHSKIINEMRDLLSEIRKELLKITR